MSIAGQVLGSLEGRTALIIGAGKMSALAARRLAPEGARLQVSSRGGASPPRSRPSSGRPWSAPRASPRPWPGATWWSPPPPAPSRCSTVLSARAVQETAGRTSPLPHRHGRAPGHRPGCRRSPGGHPDRHRRAGPPHRGRRPRPRQGDRGRHRPWSPRRWRGPWRCSSQRDASIPTIRALLERAETIRRREVERTLARLPAGDAELAERIDPLSRSLVRKLLHAPDHPSRGRPPTTRDGPSPPRGLQPGRSRHRRAVTGGALRLATRGSRLALAQAALAAERLRAARDRGRRDRGGPDPGRRAALPPRSAAWRERAGSAPPWSGSSSRGGPTRRSTAPRTCPAGSAAGWRSPPSWSGPTAATAWSPETASGSRR